MYQPVNREEPMIGGNGTYGTDKDPVVHPSVQPLRLDAPTTPKCNDLAFAILFLVNLITIMVVAGWKGIEAIQGHDTPDTSKENFHRIAGILGLLFGGALIFTILWMRLLLSFAEHMIRISLWLNVALLIVFSCTTIVVNPFLPFLFLILAAVNVCYIYMVQNRIAFASANLKCACRAISNYQSIVGVAIFMVLVQFVWMVVWSLAAFGTYQSFRQNDASCAQEEEQGHLCGGTGAGAVFFLLLLSLYWGQQVIQNILTCTTAGTVATWWYQEQGTNVVFGSMYRSLTTSFGSICFGSLLVAILQALQTMARILRDKAREDDNNALACVACLAECILNCLEGIMEYINMWAFCYVGIYGYDFKTSGKAVMELFKNRGWTAVINDDLTSSALSLGAFGVGLVSCGAGLLLGYCLPDKWVGSLGTSATRYGVLAGFGFVAGLAMAMVLITVITTALHTVFVCFAEDPIAFRRVHPDHYGELVEAWKRFHPNAWTMAYGNYV